jgi:hypothetical protein
MMRSTLGFLALLGCTPASHPPSGVDAAHAKVMAPNLVAARAKLKSALGAPQTSPSDGGAPNPCANNKKLQSAMDAFRALMAIGLQTAH